MSVEIDRQLLHIRKEVGKVKSVLKKTSTENDKESLKRGLEEASQLYEEIDGRLEKCEGDAKEQAESSRQAKQDLDKKATKAVELEGEIFKARNLLAAAEKEVQSLQDVLAKKEGVIGQLEDYLSVERRGHEEATAHFESALKEKELEINAIRKGLEKERSRMTMELEDHSRVGQDLAHRLEDERREFRNEKEMLMSELHGHQQALQESQEALNSVQRDLTNRIFTLEEKLREERDFSDRLKREVDTQMTVNRNLMDSAAKEAPPGLEGPPEAADNLAGSSREAVILEHQVEITPVEQEEMVADRAKVRKLEKDVAAYQQEIQALELENESRVAELKNALAGKASAETHVTSLTKHCNSMEAELKAASSRCHEMEERVKEVESRLVEVHSEIHEEQAISSIAHDKLETSEREIDCIKHENQDLMGQLDKLRKEGDPPGTPHQFLDVVNMQERASLLKSTLQEAMTHASGLEEEKQSAEASNLSSILADAMQCAEEMLAAFDNNAADHSSMESDEVLDEGVEHTSPFLSHNQKGDIEEELRAILTTAGLSLGHNNPKQRIQYHLRLKQELEELRRECVSLLREKFHLEQCIRYLAARCQLYQGVWIARDVTGSHERDPADMISPKSLTESVLYSTPTGRRLLLRAGRGAAALKDPSPYKPRLSMEEGIQNVQQDTVREVKGLLEDLKEVKEVAGSQSAAVSGQKQDDRAAILEKRILRKVAGICEMYLEYVEDEDYTGCQIEGILENNP